MKLIAHRGYHIGNIKENTMEAFENALLNGFVGIECDVRKTKDNKLVICHDAFIDRVSDGSGLISTHTYQELLNYNFGSKEIPSKIPLLKDVLTKFKVIKLIELKTRIDLKQILKYIDDKTYFMSFDTSYILELKKDYPSLKFGVLNYILNSQKDYSLNMICLLDSIITKKLEMHFENKNIEIYLYGIGNKPRYISERVYYIVDKIIK